MKILYFVDERVLTEGFGVPPAVGSMVYLNDFRDLKPKRCKFRVIRVNTSITLASLPLSSITIDPYGEERFNQVMKAVKEKTNGHIIEILDKNEDRSACIVYSVQRSSS